MSTMTCCLCTASDSPVRTVPIALAEENPADADVDSRVHAGDPDDYPAFEIPHKVLSIAEVVDGSGIKDGVVVIRVEHLDFGATVQAGPVEEVDGHLVRVLVAEGDAEIEGVPVIPAARNRTGCARSAFCRARVSEVFAAQVYTPASVGIVTVA